MTTPVRLPSRMTVAEIQDWMPPDDLRERRWELVDGEPVCMSPPSIDNGLVQSEAARLIGNHLAAVRPDCRIVVTPGVVPRVRADSNERLPDLGVVCGPARPARFLTDPLLLIEVLSPSNEAKTRANVWAYCSIPSVQEVCCSIAPRSPPNCYAGTRTDRGPRSPTSSATRMCCDWRASR